MSMDKMIADLTAALLRNAEATEAHTAAIDKMAAGAASAKTTSTKAAAADTSDADAEKAAKAEKVAKAKAAKEKAAADKAAAEKAAAEESEGDGDEISVAEAAERVTTYLKTGDKAERAERKANIGKIIEHYDVARFTAIPGDKLAEALGYVEDFEEGRTPEFMADSDDDGDDDGDVV
jgi:colicin import membrane protein